MVQHSLILREALDRLGSHTLRSVRDGHMLILVFQNTKDSQMGQTLVFLKAWFQELWLETLRSSDLEGFLGHLVAVDKRFPFLKSQSSHLQDSNPKS